MKLSDKIANCKKCQQMTKAFNTDGAELFQIAWLKIREKELKGKSFKNVKDYKGYFFLTLRNVFIDEKRKDQFLTTSINDKICTKKQMMMMKSFIKIY